MFYEKPRSNRTTNVTRNGYNASSITRQCAFLASSPLANSQTRSTEVLRKSTEFLALPRSPRSMIHTSQNATLQKLTPQDSNKKTKSGLLPSRENSPPTKITNLVDSQSGYFFILANPSSRKALNFVTSNSRAIGPESTSPSGDTTKK